MEEQSEKEPLLGLTTQAEIVSIIDGDTYLCKIERFIKVRLQHQNSSALIFDCPEKDTPLGQKTIRFVKRLLKPGTKVKLFIPTNDKERFADIFTFDRIVGEVWLGGKRITSILMEKGLGRLVKRQERTKKEWE